MRGRKQSTPPHAHTLLADAACAPRIHQVHGEACHVITSFRYPYDPTEETWSRYTPPPRFSLVVPIDAARYARLRDRQRLWQWARLISFRRHCKALVRVGYAEAERRRIEAERRRLAEVRYYVR